MQSKTWTVGLVVLLLLGAGCDRSSVSQSPDLPSVDANGTPANGAEAIPEISSTAQPLSDQDFFPDAMVASEMQPLPVPNLIPPTAPLERLPQVETGRADPFASLGFTPTVVATRPPAVNSTPVVAAEPASLPSVSVAALPQPAPLPPPSLSATPPAVSVPAPMPVQSLAEAIEISGVVEVGGVTNLIVQVPDEETSRSVAVGEYLANGQVLVKRVDMGLEPVVILEQDGKEVVRAIGSSNALIGAL
ncbi:MAG: hypothetical protein IGS50_10755 [Synechococcales cyanobacterium C42_A2020_086]|jgi:hypothetical protein|nr:hypothetical protein [Synechococcales cyanobacterium C42_A2020_086]